jgi:hypothetical protein
LFFPKFPPLFTPKEKIMATYNLGTAGTTPIFRNNFNLSTSQPTDVFRFSVGTASTTSPRYLNLAVTDISAADDADISLFRDVNNNGVLDSTDRQSGLVRSSVAGSNADDSINVRVTTGGTYFAEVSRYAPGSSGDVSYDFRVSNNTSAASNLLPNEVRVGDLNSDRTFSNQRVDNLDTNDTYAFSLGLFEGVNIRLNGLTADADIRVINDSNNNRVVDAGEVVRSSTSGGTTSDVISGLNDSGNYYLQVYAFNGAQTNYNVTFDHYTTPFA